VSIAESLTAALVGTAAGSERETADWRTYLRLDAHQHFWKFDPQQYAWITEQMTVLRRDFLPSDLDPLLHAAGLDGSVAVQARQSLEETRWLLELSDQFYVIKAVVGWVDLRSQALMDELDLFSRHSKFRGVRHVLQDEQDDEFMLRPEFLRGIEALQRYRLTYDLLLFPRHLPIAASLVRRFPQQPFVLDHLGKPAIRSATISPWAQQLRELARSGNVWCKLSGMVTEAVWRQWRPSDFTPYLDVALDAFGPGRVMIGSDWPVCLLSGEYCQVIEAVAKYAEQFSIEERQALLGENCASFYGIGEARSL
jgi:L-fuconolactonase